MQTQARSRLTDVALLREFADHVAKERGATAVVLADIAEIAARKLYRQAGYPSMFEFLVREMKYSEAAAYKRLRAAVAARRFPEILKAIEGGRLHLSGVVLLVPLLSEDTADELLAMAAHKTKSQIEQALAQRFPKPDVPTRIRALPSPQAPLVEPPGQFVQESSCQLAPGPIQALDSHVWQQPDPPTPRARVTPIAPQRFAMQVTIREETRELLQQAQDLLSHEITHGDVAEVLHRALATYVEKLQKRKFAATATPRPRRRQRNAPSARHVPSDVKRKVWTRDEGRCTFVGELGTRCPATSSLEFDHVIEVARGGRATLNGIRLRCRGHNQYTAECTFGREFMAHKRELARSGEPQPAPHVKRAIGTATSTPPTNVGQQEQ